MYGVAKELATILKPLVGNTMHPVTNRKEFVEQSRNISLQEGKCIITYDITAIFTSLPAKITFYIFKNKQEQDAGVKQKTITSVKHMIELLGFILNNTYFLFQGQFYKQIECAAIGSPVNPTVINLYRKHLKPKL